MLAKSNHFSIMPRVPSIIVFQEFQYICQCVDISNVYLTYDLIQSNSIRLVSRFAFGSYKFHDKRQYCALCIGSKQHMYSVHVPQIYVSSFAYVPIFVLAESPNGINKRSIFQSVEQTKKNSQIWMRRWMKKNQSRIEIENENVERTDSVFLRAWFSLAPKNYCHFSPLE